MTPDPSDELLALESELERLRVENGALADRFRAGATPALRDELKRAANRLHEIRDRIAELTAADDGD